MIPPSQTADYYSGCNRALLQAVPGEARIILEVGCAEGHLGAALKQLRPDRTVFGIEREPEVAARAVWHGAGISTAAHTSTARLRSLIRMALSEPSLRVAAGQLAARMAADNPDIAVRELENIATGARSTVTD